MLNPRHNNFVNYSVIVKHDTGLGRGSPVEGIKLALH